MTNYSKPKNKTEVCHLNPHLDTRLILLFSVVILSLTSCVWVTLLHRQTYKEQSQLLTTDAPAKQQGEQPEASMKRTQPNDYITA